MRDENEGASFACIHCSFLSETDASFASSKMLSRMVVNGSCLSVCLCVDEYIHAEGKSDLGYSLPATNERYSRILGFLSRYQPCNLERVNLGLELIITRRRVRN